MLNYTIIISVNYQFPGNANLKNTTCEICPDSSNLLLVVINQQSFLAPVQIHNFLDFSLDFPVLSWVK